MSSASSLHTVSDVQTRSSITSSTIENEGRTCSTGQDRTQPNPVFQRKQEERRGAVSDDISDDERMIICEDEVDTGTVIYLLCIKFI